MESCFCHGSVFIFLLLPENMIICDKCLSKCGKPAKLNDLRFLLHFPSSVKVCLRGKHKGYRDQYFNALVTLLIFSMKK